MKNQQSARGSRNVQIQDVDRSLIQITYEGTPRTVPLEPAVVPVATRTPSPARLIRAHASVFPYLDRGDLLAGLVGWVSSEASFAGEVISGRGGSGKTRLAVELCSRLKDRDWLCGFLARIADQAMLDALVQAPVPRLVVVDYAESRVEQLELLMPLLRADASPERPVRVLLLVRTGSREGDLAALRNRLDSLDALLDECETQTLEETPMGAAGREELFQIANRAFADRMDTAASPPSVPALAEEVFSSPLMVVIAAYLAARSEAAPPTVQSELVNEILAHERRYWRNDAAKVGADDVLLERAVALATLTGAEGEAEAAELLRLLPDLEDAPAERRNLLARWVRRQYPGPRWWNPLEPDLLGEHLVAECFAEQPAVLRGVLGGDRAKKATRPLQVLTRAVPDHEGLAAPLRSALSDSLGNLCETAIEQAETTTDRDLLSGGTATLASAVASAVTAVEVDADAVRDALLPMPPRPNFLLNELEVVLTNQHIEHNRSKPERDDSDKRDLRISLSNLSVRLAAAGRRGQALKAAEEAVALQRQLAVDESDTEQARLASSLSELSTQLAAVGRLREALQMAEEAVETYRGAGPFESKAHEANFAGALNGLSNRLATLGRHEEAVAPAEQAVQTFRALANAAPAAHEPDLALALNNFANRLASTDQHERSLAAIEEAVEIRRRLAAVNPAAHRAELAAALNNFSLRLAETDEIEQALAISKESVAAYRDLAAANSTAYLPDLALALNNLGLRLEDVGSCEAALAAVQESVAIWRSLRAAHPAAIEPDLAQGLHNLSLQLGSVGSLEEAVSAIEESVAIHRELTRTDAPVHEPQLASALIDLVYALARTERYEAGLEAARESVALSRSLAVARPSVFELDLAQALGNLRICLEKLGFIEEMEQVESELRLLGVSTSDGEAAT